MSSLCACQLLSVYKIRLSKSKPFHGAENIANGSRKKAGRRAKSPVGNCCILQGNVL